MTELKPAIQANPIIAMNLCDMLWQQPYWETRYLATTILGQVVDKDFTPVMDRLTAWLSDGPEDQLVSLILENATNQLRRNQPDRVFDWIKKLLVSPKKYDPNIALRLLTTMVRDNSPENYPTIFKLINPLLREVPPALRQDLLELVSELAHRSPGEMAYILQTYLKNEDNSDTAWIIRQTLVDFPPSQQETLRAVLRSL